jgi:hypothetical protein
MNWGERATTINAADTDKTGDYQRRVPGACRSGGTTDWTGWNIDAIPRVLLDVGEGQPADVEDRLDDGHNLIDLSQRGGAACCVL